MKLLLVEYAALDRFHRAVLFPFIQGYARSAGIETRWLRFAVRAAAGPGEADRAALESVIRDFAPDLTLFDADVDLDNRPLDALLGRDDPAVRGPGLFENVTPDYGYEPANRAARELEPLPFLFIGEECTYNHPFSSNPFLGSLPLDEFLRQGGCAFCTRPAHGDPWKTDPLTLLRRQLEAVARTLPGAAGGLQVRLVGEQPIKNIEAVAREALNGPIHPLELLIDSRADRFVQAHDSMRKALDSLESTDCRIEMALMGVENFCSQELIRLNKGLTPETHLRAVRQLFELERDYPSSFGFRKHGGLSMITLNPWTAPTEVVLNLMVIRTLGLFNLAGKLLTGRLRLYPELPLQGAARRDGLLIDSYTDPLLDTARMNMYQPETPWKFENPEMEALNRVFVRLAPEGSLSADPVTRALDAAGVADRGITSTTLDAAVRLVDGAVQAAWSGSRPDPVTLVEEMRALPAEPQSRLPGVDTEVLLGIKPVIKLDAIAAGDRSRFEEDSAFPNARWRGRANSGEVFFGRRVEDVEAALQTAEDIDRLGGEDFSRAVERMGRLLGYPACCAAAFSTEPVWMQDNYFWLHVKRRLENPGEVPCEFNPAANPLLEYVPCSLACQASLERVRRLPPPERLQNPALLFWAGQEHSLELIPEDQPSERFRYRPGHVQGADPLIQAVCRGDELVLEEECTTVLKQGRPLCSLSGRAFLWWHRRCFQTAFWRSLLEVLEVHDPREQQTPEAAAPTDFTRKVTARLDDLKARREGFAGFVLEKSEPTPEGRVRALLAAGGERLVLDIGPRRPGEPCYLEAGAYLLTYPMDCPIESERQRQAAQEFADALRDLSPAP